MTRAERVYLAVVAALAADTFSSRDGTFGWWPHGVLFALLMPVLVVAMPVVYVVGATAWNVTGADAGGPMWPVTLVYALLLTAVGAANVLVVRAVRTRWRARAAGAPTAGASHTEGRPLRPAGGGKS